MASGAKCFILNRKSDWTSLGLTKNMGFRNDSMISQVKNGENGVYISRAFDSMQNGIIWHRLRLDIDYPTGSIFKLRIYASDTQEITIAVPGIKGKSSVNFNE